MSSSCSISAFTLLSSHHKNGMTKINMGERRKWGPSMWSSRLVSCNNIFYCLQINRSANDLHENEVESRTHHGTSHHTTRWDYKRARDFDYNNHHLTVKSLNAELIDFCGRCNTLQLPQSHHAIENGRQSYSILQCSPLHTSILCTGRSIKPSLSPRTTQCRLRPGSCSGRVICL